MRDRALHALVSLELARVKPVMLRTLRLAVGAAALMAVVGWGTAGRYAFLLSVLGISGLTGLLMSVVRDKLDGGIEFVVALPVPRGTLAAARLAACGIVSIPAGASLVAAFWLAYRDAIPSGGGFRLLVAMFPVAVCVVALPAALGVALTLRIEASRIGNVMFGGMLVFFALAEVLDHAVPDADVALIAFLTRPWAPGALVGALAALVGAGGWLAYRLARTGYERFRPVRDKATW
jgi:ABC-type Na+ efflux pump permease subunit